MSDTPEAKAIHEAVQRYTDIHGIEGATLGKVVESIAAALAIRWKQMREAAEEPENGGKITATLKIPLDFTGNAPKGVVKLSFTPKRVSEVVEFQVEDPNQGRLELDITPHIVCGPPAEEGQVGI